MTDTTDEKSTKSKASKAPTKSKESSVAASRKQIKSGSKQLGPMQTLVLSLFVGFVGGFIAVQVSDISSADVSSDGDRVILQESELIADVADKVGPSVVSITVESQSETDIFGRSYRLEGAGTGVIISSDGYVLTNKHVIDGVNTGLKIVMSDGTEHTKIEIVGRDPFNDIAYLKIKDVSGLTPATIGDSSLMRVGDKVVAIGNALGEFDNTVTQGIISGLSRPLIAGDGTDSSSLQNLFQTDASINPGNSGGPLLNLNGEVIALNTAVAGNAENIGFAIPINDAKAGITSVVEQGRLVKPYLGVRYVTISDEVAQALDLPVNRGAYLDADIGQRVVLSGSPAEKAGLKEGDIIIKVGGDNIDENNSLVTLIGQIPVGNEVDLTILRDGEELVVKVTLEEVPQDLSG